MDREDISRPGDSPLLQVPMTVVSRYASTWAGGLRKGSSYFPYVRRYVFRSLPAYSWLQTERTEPRRAHSHPVDRDGAASGLRGVHAPLI